MHIGYERHTAYYSPRMGKRKNKVEMCHKEETRREFQWEIQWKDVRLSEIYITGQEFETTIKKIGKWNKTQYK